MVDWQTDNHHIFTIFHHQNPFSQNILIQDANDYPQKLIYISSITERKCKKKRKVNPTEFNKLMSLSAILNSRNRLENLFKATDDDYYKQANELSI